jgi:hypothetical protein
LWLLLVRMATRSDRATRDAGGLQREAVGAASRSRGEGMADALPVARELGISRVLITCDEDNVGPRATIEKNGGVYNRKRRYWAETEQLGKP